MTNKEKVTEQRNHEKELNDRRNYEICSDTEEMESCENEHVVVKICNILISENLSYREANRVLYDADKALRIKAMEKKLL